VLRPILAACIVVTMLVKAFGACNSSSSSSSAFVTTGILVRAETLISGRGCGRGPTNVFKYAVAVFGLGNGDPLDRASYTTPVTGNVFDCFADGTFIELAPVAGSTSFRLEVFVYNEASYQASRDLIDTAVSNTTALRASSPTWTTQCTATQLSDVQSVALCDPIAPGLGGVAGEVPGTRITLGTTSFRLGDGRVGICVADADAGVDSGTGTGTGTGTGDAGDAGRDGSAEAGAPPGEPVRFTTARIRYRRGNVVGTTEDVPCPKTYLVDVPAEPARYDLDVGLLNALGEPVAQTTCFATTQVGATSTAVCP
jgi:hypothetical protein